MISIVSIGAVVKPVWKDTLAMEPATDIMRGFYAEPKDSLDVVFLGSSHVFCAINPLAIYDETYLKSYSLGSGQQRNWISYLLTTFLFILKRWQF